MIIPITFDPTMSSCPKLPPTLAKISDSEIVLIELQGYLEMNDQSVRERDGQLVGKLTVDASTNKATLFIGHNLLEGKIVSMPKPYGIMVKGKRPIRDVPLEDDEEKMDVDIGESKVKAQSEVEPVPWNIQAIVKRKILFSKRPVPIVGKSSMSGVS
ncbi:Ctf8-domain-containing protein [Flagelloscypha sp. PMI_526]|nr:Ctf8-domain-containing protein [Flagelloscypha sp. PMI_526]